MSLDISLDKLVGAFVRIRDAKAALVKAHEEEVETLDAQMSTIKSALLEHCKATGTESARTTAGTFFRGTKSRYWTNDWESMGKFIIEHQVIDLLEKRVAQGNMKKFLDENPELVPPGLNIDTEYTITVRKEKANG